MSLFSPKKTVKFIPGKFDPTSCANLEVPTWSQKSVDHQKNRSEVLSASISESKTLFHKESKMNPADRLNASNTPVKYQKPAPVGGPRRAFREPKVQLFPVGPQTKLRSYQPLQLDGSIPAVPTILNPMSTSFSDMGFPSIGISPSSFDSSRITVSSPSESISPVVSSFMRNQDPRYLKLDDSRIPSLECYDDATYETKSPEEWLATCNRGFSPFYHKGEWIWIPCTVQSYNSETHRYHIFFDSFQMESDVTRLNLRFEEEDEQRHQQRLADALARRTQTKYDLRFKHYILTDPLAVQPLSPTWLDSIHERMVSTPSLSELGSSPSLEQLGKEVLADFDLAMKRVSVRTQLKFEKQYLARYQDLGFHTEDTELPVSEYGKISMEPYKFEACGAQMSQTPHLLRKEVYHVLITIQENWVSRIGDRLLVDVDDLPLPCTLESLADHQRRVCEDMILLVREKWYLHVKDCILDSLQDIYDFYLANAQSYEGSEMSKVMKLLDNIVQTYLQRLLVDSVNKWTDYLCKFGPTQEHMDYGRDEFNRENPAYGQFLKEKEEADALERKRKEEELAKKAEEEKKKNEKSKKSRGIVSQDDFEEVTDSALGSQDRPPTPKCLHPIPHLFSRPGSSTTWGSWNENLLEVSLVPNNTEVFMKPSKNDIRKVFVDTIEFMVDQIASFQRLEPQTVPLLYIPQQPLIDFTDRSSNIYYVREYISDCIQRLVDLVELSTEGPCQLIDRYQAYAESIPRDPIAFSKPFDGVPDLAAILHEIQKFFTARRNLMYETYDDERFGLCMVHCSTVKMYYEDRAIRVEDELTSKIFANAREKCSCINTQYEDMMKKVTFTPQNEEELQKTKQFINSIDGFLQNLNREIDIVYEQLCSLSKFFHKVPKEEFDLTWSAKKWPKRIKEAAESNALKIDRNKLRMMESLEKEKDQFSSEIGKYAVSLRALFEFGEWEMVEKVMDKVNNLETELKEAKEKVENFNRREEIFGWESTTYPQLKEICDQFQPHLDVWTMAADFKANRDFWLTSPFINLDGNEIDNFVNTWWTSSYKLLKKLEKDYPKPAKIARTLREQTDDFRKNVPVIRALASKALQERHWEQLSEVMGVKIVPDEDLTLNLLVEYKVMDYWDRIQEITVYAEKEYNLEKSLEDMMNQWDDIKFTCMAYKNSGTYVIKAVEDVMALLDDHIVKTQTMMGSPFIAAIKPRCKTWEKKLQYAQSLIDEWMMCQRTWMALEPIFGSEDIMRQMPTESRRFQAVDSTWRSTMSETFSYPRVMDSAGKDKLLDKFKGTNKMLDHIQKGLNDYLEVKRLSFPRFYFLANNELLEILSQTKDPRTVQRYLGKCFEGIHSVVFKCDDGGSADDVTITTMVSSEGEKVPLLNTIDPNEGANKGNVEKWLTELQLSMRLTLKDIIMKAIKDYVRTPRTQWVLKWPGQTVLCVNQLIWTKEVTEALHENHEDSLSNYIKKLNAQLNDIVKLVRGNMTSMDRLTLSALTVIDVHARDVIQLMIDQDVQEESDFGWMAQLRYYWEYKVDEYERYGKDHNNMLARIVNAEVMYGYEYLGNSTRLVITPLTDRCYRTMMGAVSLDYGGAPAGPAGTGKTETVKDLSKAVAIQCVVFNCSDGLDYLAMAKFFKGLAASGAWACFDEFNRIELEVLSVIAQQLLTILKAKRIKMRRFLFEGSNIPLNPDCNSFITMNPGYAGRSELPDNLQALFRSCAMMVPDYAMIAEIKLYSFGFEDARNMARKLTQVLKLCSEQLSSQKHYDYGMRAVFSILIRAGNLRQERDWSEDLIVLSAIIDVNLPKFTANDIPLFEGILSDLFPGVKLPSPDYGPLIPSISSRCISQNLQPKPLFLRSIIQLWETVVVRHGLMVVGETYSGKSSVIKTLALAVSENSGTLPYTDVKITTLNPKSINQGQLYGRRDENTGEWFDGVLASIFRTAADDSSPCRQWILFDGPVDAVWIENMNTVLDDNKKLCLNSGEIIKMSNYMTMMFEPADLEEASPATVSRCGMVYLEQSRLGWEALVDSWLFDIPEKKEDDGSNRGQAQQSLDENGNPVSKPEDEPEGQEVAWATAADKIQLRKLFSWLLPPLLYAARVECPQMTPITPMEFTSSCLRLLDCFISQEFLENDAPPVGKNVIKVLESMLVMSAVWSIGAVTTGDGRATFHRITKSVVTGQMTQDPFYGNFIKKNPFYLETEEGPAILTRSLSQRIPEGSIYDFQFIAKGMRWQSWLNLVKESSVPEDSKYNSIVVPTIDTIRTDYLVDLLLTHRKHILLTGDTGTGKSVLVASKLLNGLPENYTSLTLNFSAQTSAQMTQDIIEGKLMKRRKGVLGPNVGKICLIFVDDLNMPAKETYGAQPPIELLRQWMDHQGWYDLKTNEFTKIIDVQFIAAMGPPGGGRTQITQRYVRHFNVVGLVPFDNDSLKRIFTKITEWIMSPYPNAYKQTALQIVDATLGIYQTIAQELLPTPTKSHYTFNLRDLSKVFQGISICAPKTIEGVDDLIRLWGHECMRVFHDRLVDETDRTWFVSKLSSQCDATFNKNWEKQILGKNDVLIYGNFLEPNIDPKPYGEIRDRDRLRKVMNEYLEDYNNMNPTHMNLVLFQNAIEHIARISRVLNQPYGNALLVGVGGSGKKSLATMAAFMAEYKLYKIEITKSYSKVEWREDLKKILKITGLEGKPLVFLFNDTQIVSEAFVEDINNVLNSGDVPNLYDSDELVQLLEEIAPQAQKAGKNPGISAEVYSFFIDRSRSNLHLVLAFSPIGDAFRMRLRMFPSLVNCCTIDWFTDWPEEALRSVADHFLNDVEVEDTVKNGVVNICVEMQSRVSRMTLKFLQELQRHFYVTPTSYLELINTFKSLLSKKRDEVRLKKKRYDNGLKKLADTQEQVSKMQEDLKELQPKLRVAQEETEQKLKNVEAMQRDTDEKKKVVESEAKECKSQADEAEAMERDCSEQLAVALPAMEAAIAALKTLDKSSLVEVKSMKKPPAGVKLTMEAVCILLGIKPKRVFDESGRNKIDDYWEPAQKEVLSNSNLLKILQEYDKDHIPEEIIAKISPYISRADFEPAVVYKASLAAGGLCKWVHAIVKYDVVAKVVAPKRAALEIARSTMEAANTQLESKRSELAKVIAKVRALEEELNVTIQRKLDLEKKVDDCKKKLDRAQRLLGGLGGEQTRWFEFSKSLAIDYENLVGDILMSSGVIAYLGSFPMLYRSKCIEEWSIQLDLQKIPRSQQYSLSAILGDPISIRKWTITKLPNDSFSIDNAIMLFQSHRWPLMIDPEGQANRWVRNLEANSNLKIVKQSSSAFVRTLENSIQFGAPVLLENLPESLDPILETILLKQVIKVGGINSIRIGDNTVTYDDRFKLYMTTRIRNPHFSPETCVKVNLLNFMATQEGLQDQMLGILVGKEQEDLERRREQLVLEDAENKRKLKEIEDEILNLLASSEGDILDDEKLIDTLAQSKVTGNQIQIAVSRAESTQKEITQVRKSYEPVAERASSLFFCISDLAGVETMYQYSMDWYINLFLMAIDKAPRSKVLVDRLTNLNDKFTLILYENVCRSLFQKDKLLFSFLLCNKILIAKGEQNPVALRYFLAGNVLMSLEEENPVKDDPRWLSDKCWGDILGLKSISGMESFVSLFKKNLKAWRDVYFSSEPIKPLDDLLEGFTTFQKLLVIKAIRPDKVVQMIQRFITEGIGRRFIEIPSSDLAACYNDSNPCSPLIFILSPGADPMHDLLKLAEKMSMSKKMNSVSLGQGQGPIAEEAITLAVDKGMWVCLQNCHLAESWMSELERICEENTAERCHPDFRLWLTSMPSSKFPTTVLQNGVKMTTEPPRGLQNNLQGTFSNIDSEWFERCPKSFEFKKLLFGLAFFHATVIERVRFGPLGWNIPYVFSLSDLQISMDQLMLFLTKYEEINFEMLNYLAGECNYGGRVTDDKDRRCIMSILTDFYTESIMDDDYRFSPSGIYFAPPDGPLESYLEYIRGLPLNESPEVYGLHENADITCANQETSRLLESVLSLQPRTSGGAGKSWEDTLTDLAKNISSKIPDVFDVERVAIKYPVVYEESLNTVLVQELMRYNGLLSVIKKSLVAIERAIKGFVVMSLDLETMGNSMVNGWVPQKWKAVAYPSLKPLGSWVNDLCARVTFLNHWIENGAPSIFWISGFFFTQSFLTGVRQNFARKYTIPIDEISYDYRVFTRQEQHEVHAKAPDGCYVTGLFLEGANWDNDTRTLCESRPKELFVEMPLIHLIPMKLNDIDPDQHVYECPTYKTSERRGVLSTTGHSTNFVLMINLPMSKEHTQKHWIKRGVALLTQLDD